MNKYKFDFPNEGWDTMQFCKRVPNEDQLEVALFQHNAKGMEFYRVDEVDARIAELQQELIDQADQHAKILAPTLSPKYRHQGCYIAQRACSSGCPYWGEFADTLVEHNSFNGPFPEPDFY